MFLVLILHINKGYLHGHDTATKRARATRAMVTAMAMGVAANKRGKGARAMALAMRVVCDKENNGDGGKSNGIKGGR